jgi:diketogulonate reductase-like aldo/keto reductase
MKQSAKKIFVAFLGAIFVNHAFSQVNEKTCPSVKLNSGFFMPVLGLGTWTLTGKTCEDAVYESLKIGFRLIDTAKYYGNETEVGKGIARAVSEKICTREEIFITTKIVPWSKNPSADIDDSLKKLGVDYIDLCLLHQHGSGDEKVYRAMEKAAAQKKIRSIGISNFYTKESVEFFLKNFSVKPSVLQNENHIFFQQKELQDFAENYGMVMESYYPFGGRGHTAENFANPVIKKIAERKQKSPAQIILRYHFQSGFVAVPGSSDKNHIAENFRIWDFELSRDEMDEIAALNKNRRYENW